MPRMSNQGRALLTQWEGYKSHVYRDTSDLPTIGVGHLLTESERFGNYVMIGIEKVPIALGLTDKQIDSLLMQDLAHFESAVTAMVTVRLTQNQADALISFAFNLGIGTLHTSTLLRELNAGNYADVPTQMRRFTHSNGVVVPGLVNRREKEISLWLS